MTITIMLMEERPDSGTCLLECLRDISQHGWSFCFQFLEEKQE